MRNGTIAKLAAKVSEYYAEAGEAAYEAKGGGGVWPLFSFPVVSIFLVSEGYQYELIYR